jgi:hypothetical protein
MSEHEMVSLSVSPITSNRCAVCLYFISIKSIRNADIATCFQDKETKAAEHTGSANAFCYDHEARVSMMTGADHDHEVIVSVIILTNIDE